METVCYVLKWSYGLENVTRTSSDVWAALKRLKLQCRVNGHWPREKSPRVTPWQGQMLWLRYTSFCEILNPIIQSPIEPKYQLALPTVLFFLVSVHVENETFFWAKATNTTTLFGASSKSGESRFNRETNDFQKMTENQMWYLVNYKAFKPT